MLLPSHLTHRRLKHTEKPYTEFKPGKVPPCKLKSKLYSSQWYNKKQMQKTAWQGA